MGKLIKFNFKYKAHDEEIETKDRDIELPDIFMVIYDDISPDGRYFKRYVMNNPNVNFKKRDSSGRTILHLSTRLYKYAIMSYILKHKLVDINAKTVTGATATVLAIAYQMPMVLMILVRYNPKLSKEEENAMKDLIGIDKSEGYLTGGAELIEF